MIGSTTVRFGPTRFHSRFVGPVPDLANGGIVAGTLAEALGPGPVTVRLERPIPIEAELGLEVVAGTAELRAASGERLAVGRGAPSLDSGEIAVPAFVGSDAAATTVAAVPRVAHPAAGCFVCGPLHPSGLDLQPGPVPGGSCLATTLHIRDDLADGPDGEVTPPVVWAAMDCPGWYAGCGGEMALLGTMTADQLRPLRAGDDIVVQAWHRDTDGRKIRVGTALWTADGELAAVSAAVWIRTPGLSGG